MDKHRESVERVNTALMVISCVAAFAAPFHLFLAAYAILGPLHYLTEISWLHDRDYFAPRRRPRRLWLGAVGVAIAVLLFGYITAAKPALEIGLVWLVFCTAPLLLWVRHPVSGGALIFVIAFALLVFSDSRAYALLAYFLVTIVHVLLFTAAFVLYGALKGRSGSAIASLFVFAACVVAFFAVDVRPLVDASESTLAMYRFFDPLNEQLMALLGLSGARGATAVMRLIAFAYTYHYLNWFSKTSVIKWHQVSKPRAAAIMAMWLGAVALYARDYESGLSLLYALSLLHVLLEFPLNHQTFAAIGGELTRGVKSWRRVRASTSPA